MVKVGRYGGVRGFLGHVRRQAESKIYTSPLLGLVPGTSESFGPPRRTSTCNEYAKGGLGRWIETLPSQDRQLPPPIVFTGEKPDFGTMVAARHPAQGVLIVDGGRILDEHGYAVAPGDRFLADTTFRFRSRSIEPMYKEMELKAAQRLEGTTLSLMSYPASYNYGHALLDALSRAAMFQKAGMTFDDVDHIVLPTISSTDLKAVVEAMGIPKEKILHLRKGDHWKCDTLIQPNFPGMQRNVAGWVPDFYRSLFPAPPKNRDLLLYVPRRSRNRNMANDAEVSAVLAEFGFKELEFSDPAGTFSQFAQARMVVGPHGAALANLAFCRPGTPVLELMPTDHQYPYWYTLCAAANLPYHVLLCQSEAERQVGENSIGSNFVAPIEDLKVNLKKLL
jgi:hypothetical protein